MDPKTELQEVIDALSARLVRWLIAVVGTVILAAFAYGSYVASVRSELNDVKQNGSISLHDHETEQKTRDAAFTEAINGLKVAVEGLRTEVRLMREDRKR